MQTFSARETEWMLELDGIELANFKRRALAFLIDWMLISLVFTLLASLGFSGWLVMRRLEGKPVEVKKLLQDKGDGKDYNFTLGPGIVPEKSASGKCEEKSPKEEFLNEAIKIFDDVIVPVLYFGILLWRGKGRTPGKRLMKIRVVSIVHRHLTFWHCIERALGYGAAALELGFGFLQYFIHPYRRCAQDRLAETIVVTEAGYQAMQQKLDHPLIPDTAA